MSADDVMEAVSLAVAGADVLTFVIYTADPVLRALVDDRGFEPDVLQLRLRLCDSSAEATSSMTLAQMSDEHFAGWWAVQEESYADELVQAGLVAREHSRERSRTDLQALLPDGRATAGQEFWSAVADGLQVGILWVAVEGSRAFVFDVHIDAGHRRRGHGRAMMLALHQSLRSRGLESVGLSVFGWNTGARALYENLGYVPVERLMSRRLTAGA